MDNQGLHESIEELIQYFHNAYGIEKEWPKTFEVSAAVYGQACNSVFMNLVSNHAYILQPGVGYWLDISVGSHGGLMFKNVELRIKKPPAYQYEPRTAKGSLD